MVNEHDCGADEISWIPAFPVGVRNRPAVAGFDNPISLSRILFANGRKRLTEQIVPSPLVWVFGSGIIRPETNAPHWVQRTGGQPLFASAQNVMFHRGVLREFGVVAREHCPKQRSQSCARLDRYVCLRLDWTMT